jgi:hypothetical protein
VGRFSALQLAVPWGLKRFYRRLRPSYVSSGSPVRTQTYGYDWLGNVLISGDAGGVTTSYTYTPANETESITSSLSNATHPANLVSNVVNGPHGPVSFSLGNGLSRYNAYDALGRVYGNWVCAGAPSQNCPSSLYGFFVNWKGSQLTSGGDIHSQLAYQYDEFNRLKSTTYSIGGAFAGSSFAYNYDRYGNRWSQTVTAGSGPSDTTFGPTSAPSQQMLSAYGLSQNVSAFLAGGPSSNFQNFGAQGFLSSGLNPTAQFVGSYGWSMNQSGGYLNITITNATTPFSFFYHAPGLNPNPPTRINSVFNPGWHPMGRVNQVFHIRVPC